MRDTLLNGIQQAAAGKPLDSNTIDSDTSSDSSASVDTDQSVRASDSTDDTMSQSEDAPTDSSDSTAQEAPEKVEAKQPTSSSKEVITISDDKGRRKIEIDFSNREQLKKYVQMAHGARKWQTERDQALARLKERETKESERDKDWQSLEEAFQSGYEHLIDRLAGRQGAFDEYVAQRQQRTHLQKTNPEAFAALQAKDLADKLAKDLEKEKSENAKFKKSITEEREQTEIKALEARVVPAFQKYRFADKLGNPNSEHRLDKMLWNDVMERLEPYETQGQEITC
jgi:hypothetical protein